MCSVVCVGFMFSDWCAGLFLLFVIVFLCLSGGVSIVFMRLFFLC